MNIKIRLNELIIYLSIRPTNYIFGRIFRFKKIIYIPKLGYLVNDAEVTKTIFHDSDHFSIKEAGGLGDIISEIWGNIPTLLSMDGDEHKKVKFLLLDLFKDNNLDTLIKDELKTFSKTLINGVNSNSGIDIVKETRLVTNKITYKLLGVKCPSDNKILQISNLVTNTMNCIDIKSKTFSNENRDKVKGFAEDFVEFSKEICQKYDPSKDSIITRLHSLGYEDESIYGFIAMFIIAGTVTVSSALPRIITLLIETKQLTKDLNNLEKINMAVDEGLRFTTPGPLLLHGIKKDTEINGYKFKSGRRVMVLLYNIMHSHKYTKKPFNFEANRIQNELINGLWFGTGAHFCMGSVLAKKEISNAIFTLAPIGINLKIIKRSYMKDGINPGYESLIIKLS